MAGKLVFVEEDNFIEEATAGGGREAGERNAGATEECGEGSGEGEGAGACGAKSALHAGDGELERRER